MSRESSLQNVGTGFYRLEILQEPEFIPWRSPEIARFEIPFMKLFYTVNINLHFSWLKVAWISSDSSSRYYSLSKRRKRLEAIGWISGWVEGKNSPFSTADGLVHWDLQARLAEGIKSLNLFFSSFFSAYSNQPTTSATSSTIFYSPGITSFSLSLSRSLSFILM